MGEIYYIPHGGGPLPLLGDPAYAGLSDMLRGLNSQIAGAQAIICVTAHWEADQPALSTAAQPDMLYDYYGFPEESYRFEYPAPGAPALAETVAAALAAAGFEPVSDAGRGFDHGTFVPMMLMRPEADIPVLQMSLLASLDPAQHLALGAALAGLLEDDIVLLGSGFSFHNVPALMGRIDTGVIAQGQRDAEAFHAWLDQVVCDPSLPAEGRRDALAGWAEAPGARFCQPREEHLLPLHVCVGAAQARGMAAEQIFGEPVSGYRASGYRWH